METETVPLPVKFIITVYRTLFSGLCVFTLNFDVFMNFQVLIAATVCTKSGKGIKEHTTSHQIGENIVGCVLY